MSTNNYYITTPIYYVNDVPHIGHAYTSVVADVLARFMRLSGKNVFFLTGTDEHGQKVEKSALKSQMAPQSFTDKMSASFRLLMQKLNVSNDDFIRTTEERHKRAAENFWQKLASSGDIYLGKYEGWYCVRDEAFYDESELIAGNLSPTGAPVEWVEEPSYFFALAKWQEKLLKFYEANPDFVRPRSRYNEVISFVKSGLADLSISRTSFEWGIKVPGSEKHVMYVWLDALTNYISALGYPDLNGDKYQQFWPANAHIIGKDILRFHAVYWPAFLMAAGLEPPQSIVAHGWWTNEGQKISKSVGNVIDPFKLAEELGIDAVRYFLIREVILGSDGNYSHNSVINRVNSELSNKIGNLMQRTLAFIYKNNNARIPFISQVQIEQAHELPMLTMAVALASKNFALMQEFKINEVLDNIIGLTEEANIFIYQQAPWHLKNTDPEKMLIVLYAILETLRYIAIMLQPFIPSSAEKMLDQLGIPATERNFSFLTKAHSIVLGASIAEPIAIFPRVE